MDSKITFDTNLSIIVLSDSRTKNRKYTSYVKRTKPPANKKPPLY